MAVFKLRCHKEDALLVEVYSHSRTRIGVYVSTAVTGKESPDSYERDCGSSLTIALCGIKNLYSGCVLGKGLLAPSLPAECWAAVFHNRQI